MSESTFSADLDALVRGEPIASTDELTRFASGIYGEEQNVTMPNALKLRIATDLGLTAGNELTTIAAPVSRRTLRAADPQRRSSRPWAIVLTTAAAILLALTGILRWGMVPGDDENRFLTLSPAVPTAEATPAASPVDDEIAWITPITGEECSVDMSTNGEPIAVSPDEFDARPRREYNVVGPANPAAASAANIAARQAFACDMAPDTLTERHASEVAMSESALPYLVITIEEQWEEGLAVSEALASYGVVPGDVAITVGGDHADIDLLENGQLSLPNPEHAFMLEDGRIVILSVRITINDSATSGPGGDPMVMTTAAVMALENGEWVLDANIPICIGDCDPVLPQLQEMVDDMLWLRPIVAEECITNEMIPADFSNEYVMAIRSRQYRACEQAGSEQTLQSPDFKVTDDAMAQEVSNEIGTGHQENGHTPGALQRVLNPELMQDIEVTREQFTTFTPGGTVNLNDGRIAVLETSVIATDGLTANTGRTNPVLTSALIWIQNGDDWLLDEEVTVCLGNCNAFWDAGLAGSPEAEGVTELLLIPEQCEPSDVFRADFMSDPRIPIGLRPGPGNASGVYTELLPAGTRLQYLCEHEATGNPTVDRMDEGRVWLHVTTEDGIEGWIREVDVRPIPSE